MSCNRELLVLFSMDSPNYSYMIDEGDRDVVDRAARQGENKDNLRTSESAQNFRRTSPHRNSIRRNAWMRSSLRKGPAG
jgi:hypothetical protein